MTFAVSVFRGASERQCWGSGQNRLVRYARGVDARSSRGSNEAQFTPSLYEDLHRVPAFIGILGCILHQQANGYFERVNPGLMGYLKPQCLKDLGNYERRPYLWRITTCLADQRRRSLRCCLTNLSAISISHLRA